MKYLFYLLMFFVITNCKTASVPISQINKTETFVEHYENGEIKTIGNTIILPEDTDNYSKKYIKIRSGFWHEFYENGQLKESGNYKLDNYKICSIAGLADMQYSYKIGEWCYFYSNGNLKAKGIYKIGKKNIENSCEGGYDINFGSVTDDWEFFDNKGNKIPSTKEIINEIEKSSYLTEFDMRID